MSQTKPLKKPLLRGYLHQEAFFASLGACALLVAKSTNPQSLLASVIYSCGLLLLFGISAIYHRPHWQPKPRAFMKRLDHSAIFILIASTFTPICLLALPAKEGHQLLLVVWAVAGAGVLQSIFWVKAPKAFTALFYVFMGWLALPYLGDLKDSLGTAKLTFIIAGGVVYTIGAIFYALKKPKLVMEVFGYHELFHLFTIIGAGLHFVAIYQLIT
jgi:hemolysin III